MKGEEEGPRFFPPVEVKIHTRAYINRILTEHFTIIPPPSELQPALHTSPIPPCAPSTPEGHTERKRRSQGGSEGPCMEGRGMDCNRGGG